MDTSLACHIFCAISNFGSEIYEADVGVIGGCIRLFDVLTVALNTCNAIFCMSTLFRYYGYQKIGLSPEELVLGDESEYNCYLPEYHERWLKMSISWLGLDFVIYFVFLMTMVILLLKFIIGRNIGMDFKAMFSLTYMCYMVQRICDTLVEKANRDFKFKFYDFDRIANKRVFIEPYKNIFIRLKLNTDFYSEMVVKMNTPEFEEDGKYMDSSEVRKWILNCCDGKITKEKMEETKIKEIRSNDMMQNTGIFYHPESIAEFQVLCLLVAWLVLRRDIPVHMLEHRELIENL